MTSRALVDGVHAAAATGLPPAVRSSTLRHLLLAVASVAAVARAPRVRPLVEHALAQGGRASTPVPGRSELFDAPGAALVVGSAAALGGGAAAAAPPAAALTAPLTAPLTAQLAPVLGAALPVLARDEADPDLLLDALALGVEVQVRVARALEPSAAAAGWDRAGLVGPLGAAVTAGLLRRLPLDRLHHAVAIASSTTLGHGEAVGTDVGDLHPGKAAVGGLLAATLAAHGSTGAPAVLDGPRGWFRAVAPDLDPATTGEVLVAGLGVDWVLAPGTDGAADHGADQRLDREADAEAAALVEGVAPGRGSDLVRAVRALPEHGGCRSLLAALRLEAP